MSTRGCVAIKKDDGWRGIYNHYDSYPTGLGSYLWEELQEVELSTFTDKLLSFTEWRDYLNGEECKYCGKEGLGQPHSIRGKIMGFDSDVGGDPDPEIGENIKRTGYPDPEGKYHDHDLDGDTSVGNTHVTSEDPDPLFVEWVYVVDSNERTLEVFTTRFGQGSVGSPDEEPTLRDDGYWVYGHCACRHVMICALDLDGQAPDWELIEGLDAAVAIDDDFSDVGEVSEHLKRGSDAKVCLVCDRPMPGVGKNPKLEDRTVGHKECISRALEELGANVNLCLQKPEDLEG